jgi:hypothetical protein
LEAFTAQCPLTTTQQAASAVITNAPQLGVIWDQDEYQEMRVRTEGLAIAPPFVLQSKFVAARIIKRLG